MKKIKLLLSIGLAMFVIFIIGCSKNEFGLNDQNAEQVPVSIENVLTNSNIVSITENYTDKDTGITGTLYVIKNSDGTLQEVLKVDKEVENIADLETKSWIKRASVVTTPDHIECIGAKGNCMQIFNKIIIAW